MRMNSAISSSLSVRCMFRPTLASPVRPAILCNELYLDHVRLRTWSTAAKGRAHRDETIRQSAKSAPQGAIFHEMDEIECVVVGAGVIGLAVGPAPTVTEVL